ncbi:MAG: DUF507 family protein [Nitrospinae bacterium]|nr:DUF507 family protein [Nitrospinota bacterium]
MKLRDEMIDYLAHRIVVNLEAMEMIDCEGNAQGVIESIAGVMTADLMVEDLLNDEVKEILENKGEEMESVDYRKMFNMVKSKLARERGLIL